MKRPLNQAAAGRVLGAMATLALLFVTLVANKSYDPAGALNARVFRLVSGYLDTPYLADPLGEGPDNPNPAEHDKDPLLRRDAFDCMTFAETVMAEALANSPAEAPALLNRIRYRDGAAAWRNRRHFVISQWIPDLQREGFIADASSTATASATTQVIVTHLGREVLNPRWRAFVDRMGAAFKPGEYRIPVAPVETFGAIDPARIAMPALAFVIKQPRPGLAFRVSHVVVLARDAKGETWVYHASKRAGKVVRQTAKSWFRFVRQQRRWPAVGVNIQQILPPSTAAPTP